MRTHYAGSLRGGDAGSTITVCGWVAARRDHGGVVFLDLRDASGILQIVIDPATPAGADSSRIRSEFVLQVTGVVRPRPGGTLNVDLPTGEV
ncbi:MAG: aspartate--tRNA ligase, partial [Actinobacteria bacterium]|nr:aspartate--tRNA ligase [Actinomycetota bacterium]